MHKMRFISTRDILCHGEYKMCTINKREREKLTRKKQMKF